jgi:hypothetical protein
MGFPFTISYESENPIFLLIKENKKIKQTIIHELEFYTLILLDMASNVLSHLTSCVAISERRKYNKHKYTYNYGIQSNESN